MSSSQPLERIIEQTVREEWGRILASLTKSVGDMQLAEDCLQEAVLAAMVAWEKNGIPKTPAAWLITAAKRKAIDRFRTIKTHFDRQDEISRMLEVQNIEANQIDMDEIPDKRLEMIFTCCHPALEQKTQVALTLRTLGGLTVEEIAASFLDKKEAMAQRLVRAKKKISAAKIPYEIPDKTVISERISSVLQVIYLIFNEGYAAKSGDDYIRADLSNEAIRLARVVVELLSKSQDETAEASGLLAMMLLHDSRREARADEFGGLVSLEFQDRSVWNTALIAEGTELVKFALKQQKLGPYQLQAAISAVHAEASSWNETDWPQIEALYQLLYGMQPSPVVRINQALAVSYAKSPKVGLEMLAEIERSNALSSYQSFYLAKADLLTRDSQSLEAKHFLEAALKMTENSQERDFLSKKIANLDQETKTLH